MLRHGRDDVLSPRIREVIALLDTLARNLADVPMLARTHGQPATPTTLGKEMANIGWRLKRQLKTFRGVEPLAKINGAVGNFNAHSAASPDADRPALSRSFIESLGLVWNPYTTQIEPHDWIAEYCDALARINTVLLDASRDFWGYISIGHFRQRKIDSEVGSTMPHKVNLIDFETRRQSRHFHRVRCHFADKLPVSRWQRDLSDSTVLRNIGVAAGHTLLACRSLLTGLRKLEPRCSGSPPSWRRAWKSR